MRTQTPIELQIEKYLRAITPNDALYRNQPMAGLVKDGYAGTTKFTCPKTGKLFEVIIKVNI